MEKRTIETLRTMICGELEDIAKKGINTHENLDVLKDLLESAKNLEKIEKYQGEREEKEMGMDRGYSQRKYYIDADYQPGGMSYARGGRGMYDMGNSQRGMNYGYDSSNSYMYYDPRYDYTMNRGYSRAGNTKEDMVKELQQMMNETTDEKIKMAIHEAITKMNK